MTYCRRTRSSHWESLWFGSKSCYGHHKQPRESYGRSSLRESRSALYPTGYVHEWRRVGGTSLKPRGKGDRRNKPSPEQHHRLCDSRRTNCSPRADTRSSLAVRTAISDTDRLREIGRASCRE